MNLLTLAFLEDVSIVATGAHDQTGGPTSTVITTSTMIGSPGDGISNIA